MLELLAPAGSPEAVKAAVQAGADAVYLGYGDFNARRRAKNFTGEEFAQAVAYCHLRGVKVYLTLNTLVTDRELPAAAALAGEASDLGVDAVLVQDLGVARMLRQTLPDLPLHASTQMTVHNLDGVLECAGLGFTRVVLSRELSREQIAHICLHSPIEIEVFVHGAMCMCYSGQCFFSSVIGTRSGNRGMCAQPCRLKYGFGRRADGCPLSLKDMSLAGHLRELKKMGVACLKIEGRMKRAEYVGIVTQVYADAIREEREPTAEELHRLEEAFSRQGFTDGYFTGETGGGMFGVHENAPEPRELYAQARQRYLSGDEVRKTPVELYAMLRAGQPAQIAVKDSDGHLVTIEGPVPEKARTAPLTRQRVESQISRTGGTPYACAKVAAIVEPELSLPVSSLNAMRRQVLEALSAQRLRLPQRASRPFRPGVRYENPAAPPEYTVSLRRFSQLSQELLELSPAYIALPVEELTAHRDEVPGLLRQGARLAALLPRVASDGELEGLKQALEELRPLGLSQALVGSWGLAAAARRAGYALRGDYGLGVYNSQSLKELKHLGYLSATVSFELKFPQIRDLSKALDTEAIVYGRLPLMITQTCILKNNGSCPCTGGESITDRRGARFPVLKAPGCRNEIFNSKKLFLADKEGDYSRIGLRYARLLFTTESAEECAAVLRRYRNGGRFTPKDITRGLYYRDVE